MKNKPVKLTKKEKEAVIAEFEKAKRLLSELDKKKLLFEKYKRLAKKYSFLEYSIEKEIRECRAYTSWKDILYPEIIVNKNDE